jgi:molybdopterin-guanine dinucleotide biosynthesis protein A
MNAAGGTTPPGKGFVAAVLAGGEGKRLGMNKALLEIDGKTVLDRILDSLQEIFPSILLVAQEGDSFLDAGSRPGVKVVPDLFPGKGPLVGIYTALENSPAPYVFVMACDMPYPDQGLVRCLISKAPGREAVVPRRGNYIEPLFAVYSRDIRERMRARLDEGRLKIHELIKELNVRYLEEDEVAACDPDFRSFFNINTPQDLRKASHL